MLKKTFFILSVCSFFIGCKNDLEILAPYKESVAVYGLINQDDSVQYVRVQRVYLGEGNALVMAQNPDSAYYKPGELKVTLQRFKNGAQVSVDNPASASMEIVLTETFVTTDPGIFNSNQLLYRTNHALYGDSEYKLVIHNNKSGSDFSSKNISLIGDFSGKLTYGQQQSVLTPSFAFINIVPSFGGTVICKYGAPDKSGVCGLKLRFYYTEYPNTGSPLVKYEDIDLGRQYTLKTDGSDEIDLTFSGDGMLTSLTNAIGIDADVNHRTADSIRFLLNAAGPDLALYNQVNATTTLSQEKPYYSNINGGVGVFSSRREYYIRKRMSNQCLDRIASDALSCPLRFYGAAGVFLPCQ